MGGYIAKSGRFFDPDFSLGSLDQQAGESEMVEEPTLTSFT
jgi:hypothetical protein